MSNAFEQLEAKGLKIAEDYNPQTGWVQGEYNTQARVVPVMSMTGEGKLQYALLDESEDTYGDLVDVFETPDLAWQKASAFLAP